MLTKNEHFFLLITTHIKRNLRIVQSQTPDHSACSDDILQYCTSLNLL